LQKERSQLESYKKEKETAAARVLLPIMTSFRHRLAHEGAQQSARFCQLKTAGDLIAGTIGCDFYIDSIAHFQLVIICNFVCPSLSLHPTRTNKT
jgi:hypothetical protein